jgi:hypothetical protein
MRSIELPFDLLGVVFGYHVISKGPLELRTVLFVASSWYTAAIHHPHLWTMITHQSNMSSSTSSNDNRAPTLVLFSASASPEVVLCPFSSHLPSFPLQLKKNSGGRCSPLSRKEEWAVMRRCERLHWLYDDRQPFSRLDICLSPRLERLRTLCIEGLDGTFPERVTFPEVPFLEELHLWNHMTSAPPFKQFGLKKLWVSNDGLWTQMIWRPFTTFALIRWLTLESLCDVNTILTSQFIIKYHHWTG